MKKASRILSLILAASIGIQILPLKIFAAEKQEPAAVPEAQEQEEVLILGEDTQKRTADTKHFVLEDGSTIAAVYDVPVHYQDENGEWQDIDNRLVEEPAQAPLSAEDAEAQMLENAADDQSVKFAKTARKNKMVSVDVDGHTVSWGFCDALRSKIEESEKEETATGNDRFLSLPNVTQEVWYRDLFSGVDVQYILSPLGVKENLILKSKGTQTTFTIEYQIGDLSASQQDDQTILLSDESGAPVYTITAPSMTDANGMSSNQVSAKIVSQKNKKITVEIQADDEWLNEPQRAYPVTIDPDFTTDQKIDTVSSVYLSSKYPSNEYGKGGSSYEGSMYVGYFSERGKTRSMIKLNALPALSDGDVVVGAQLHLLQRASSSGVIVRASRVTGNWNVATANWNNASSLKDSNSVDYYYATYGENNDFKVQSFDITSLMKGWYEGTYPNYGVMMTADSESGTARSFCWYFSSTYPDAEAARPVFTIAYRNTKGIEPYWTYTSAQAARGTDVYVNHYNGSLTMVNTAAGVDGNRMPVTIQNIYNHGQAAWKTNFHMSVRSSPE